MIIRIHRNQFVDAVVPSAVGVVPTASPSDVVLTFQQDYNPTKTITTEVPAVDAEGNPLLNEDGTPQLTTVSNVVSLLDSPNDFTLADLSEIILQDKILELRNGYNATLADGFPVTIGTTQYMFAWRDSDDTHLQAVQSAITEGDISFPVLYADANGSPVTIPDQVTLSLIKKTAAKFFNAQHQQVLSLIGQAQQATDVGAITWTPATYS